MHTRYPMKSLLLYHGVTLAHYLVGGIGITWAYGSSRLGSFAASLYFAFALWQMYLHMPRHICPHCIYYNLSAARCVTGLNLIARRIAPAGTPGAFGARAHGPVCHNNLYIAAKVIPILAILPALFFAYSSLLLAIFGFLIALLLLRIFVIFPKLACRHCHAQGACPNAPSQAPGRMRAQARKIRSHG